MRLRLDMRRSMPQRPRAASPPSCGSRGLRPTEDEAVPFVGFLRRATDDCRHPGPLSREAQRRWDEKADPLAEYLVVSNGYRVRGPRLEVGHERA